MLNPTERISLIESLSEFLQSTVGHEVEIHESISHDAQRGHDRHCSIQSCIQLSVENFQWTMSGGSLIISGPKPTRYSISSGKLSIVEIQNNSARVTERFEPYTERLTIFKLLSS